MLGIAAALRAFLERSNCAVVSNRHMAGARLRDVIEAAQAVPPVDTLGIFLCGNDIMRGTPPADLQQAVDVLGAIARQKAQRLCVFMGGAGIWDNAPPSYEGHMERFRALVRAQGMHVEPMQRFHCIPREDGLHFDREHTLELVGKVLLRWTLVLASIHSTLRSCKCVCNLPNYICNRLMYICKLRKWVSKCFILPK